MGSVASSIVRKNIIVDMDGELAAYVRNEIATHKVVIFSKTYCPFCTMAKEHFKKIRVTPHVVELDKRNDSDEIQNILGEMTGARTVPRCFVDGKFIGGGSDVKKLYEQGHLQKMFA